MKPSKARKHWSATCQQCQGRFNTRRENQKFCSERCSRKSYRLRRGKTPDFAAMPRPTATKTTFQLIKQIIDNYRKKHRKDGWEFNIRFEEIEWPVLCPVRHRPIDYEGKGGLKNPDMWSLDRLDPTKGYVYGNVRVISNRANMIKNNGTAEEHAAIATWMKTEEGKNWWARQHTAMTSPRMGAKVLRLNSTFETPIPFTQMPPPRETFDPLAICF